MKKTSLVLFIALVLMTGRAFARDLNPEGGGHTEGHGRGTLIYSSNTATPTHAEIRYSLRKGKAWVTVFFQGGDGETEPQIDLPVKGLVVQQDTHEVKFGQETCGVINEYKVLGQSLNRFQDLKTCRLTMPKVRKLNDTIEGLVDSETTFVYLSTQSKIGENEI